MTTTTESTAPRFFPHHPYFVKVERTGLGENYTFRAFTGTEPEPVYPDHPDVPHKTAEEQTDDEKVMWAEYSERGREIRAATRCWEEARYHRQVTPLVEAACKARQPVDQALAEMDAAWTALDNALVWPVAVKKVLDAHKKARAAIDYWVDNYARPLAEAEGNQSYYVREYISDWRSIARKLGHEAPWDIGWYWMGSYDASPLHDLNRTIAGQRAELEEIARLNKRDDDPQ